MIKRHSSSPSHQLVVGKLEERLKNHLKTSIANMEPEMSDYLSTTAKVLRTVFVEMKLNIAYERHKDLLKLQTLNGLSMGHHHFERTSASRMADFLSQTMHNTLLKHLKDDNKNNALSIMVDESTDRSLHHYLVLLIVALENERPVTYFYRNILLRDDESAEGLMNAILECWDADGITDLMKKNLVGFASDGASVMTGRNNGLAKRFERFTDRNFLYAIHCMAHRLHLAIRRALNGVQSVTNLEEVLKILHNFYYGHGHKRKAHLRDFADEFGLKLREVNSVFETRWIASEYSSLFRLKDSWKTLYLDLESISRDNKHSPSMQERARNLQKNLINKNFLLLLIFLMDVLQVLAHWSQLLQTRNGLLVGQEEIRTGMMENLEILKTNDGTTMKVFLMIAKCGNDPCNSEERYRNSNPKYMSVKLIASTDKFSKLNEIRHTIIDRIKDEIENYFPEGNLKNFDILLPKKWPWERGLLFDFYGITEIIELAKLFKIVEDGNERQIHQLAQDWKQLTHQILKGEERCSMQTANPRDFWPYYLQKKNILWSEQMRKLIRTILVLPIGSADAERSFSIMNHIRTSRRSRLKPENLESLMRVRMNGPKDLDTFRARDYADLWYKAGHKRSDDPSGIKRRLLDDDDHADNVDEDGLRYKSSSDSTLF